MKVDNLWIVGLIWALNEKTFIANVNQGGVEEYVDLSIRRVMLTACVLLRLGDFSVLDFFLGSGGGILEISKTCCLFWSKVLLTFLPPVARLHQWVKESQIQNLLAGGSFIHSQLIDLIC